MNLALTLCWLVALLGGLQTFLLSVRRRVHERVQQDLFIGDQAEAIALAERRVRQWNLEIRTLHDSCAAMLLLPPAARHAAIEAAKTLAGALAFRQNAWRRQMETKLFVARSRGYRVRGDFGSGRESNLCDITGPLHPPSTSSVSLVGKSAGALIELDEKVTWQFHHPGSGDAWF